MGKLITLSAGMSSANFIAAINNNFAFLNALISDAATITTVDDTMLGDEVTSVINTNFSNLNAIANLPNPIIQVYTGTIGSILNELFNSFDIALGKALTGYGFFCEYYFSALHWCTQRDNKVLAFDDVDTLSLSLDNGETFGITLQIVGMEAMIEYAHIFANGTIMFCTTTHAYYSEDNLSTYHECTYLDKDGNPYSPDGFGPQNDHRPVSIDGNEIVVFSCYYGTDKNKVLYTLDGKTLKVFCYSTISIQGTPTAYRHVHAVNYCYIDDSFWIQTGDATGCHWIKCIYDFNAGTWSFPLKYTGDNVTWYKSCGMEFINGYCYFTAESVTAACQKFWKVKYEEMGDPTKFIELTDVNINQIEFQSDGISEILFTSYNPEEVVTVSIDLENYYNWDIVKDTTLITLYGYPITYKNSAGWYLFNIWQDLNDPITTAYTGKVMLFRIVK